MPIVAPLCRLPVNCLGLSFHQLCTRLRALSPRKDTSEQCRNPSAETKSQRFDATFASQSNAADWCPLSFCLQHNKKGDVWIIVDTVTSIQQRVRCQMADLYLCLGRIRESVCTPPYLQHLLLSRWGCVYCLKRVQCYTFYPFDLLSGSMPCKPTGRNGH